ncbi:MAG: signal recognition particle-docking protein FtsY [Myxococcota bacterium]
MLMVMAAGTPAVAYGLAIVAVLAAFTAAFFLLQGPSPGAEAGRLPGPVVPLPAADETPPAEADDDVDGTPILEVPEPEPVAPEPTLFERFRAALDRSRSTLADGIRRWMGQPRDEGALEELEEALIVADVGVTTATDLVRTVRENTAADDEGEALRDVLAKAMQDKLSAVHAPLEWNAEGMRVWLVVGVNGSGKTTTIGKLANRLAKQGKSVLLAAGDTFRAAAAEQLEVWAERTGSAFVRLDEGADPGAVAYQALDKAQADGHDVVIIDTAGRLQTRKPLMEQLSKIRRVIEKRIPDAPHETLLVIDGTMGQNGMSQARLFHEATPVTGVAVTKLDGTAKGGIVLGIASELQVPVKLVGLGEGADDLRDFEPEAFVRALIEAD